ncbi:MAG: gamma-glutamyl-gamma-aminobutyrate hydrolase family protein [Terracidiphilus sp.]|nr:gamma-glutamyl-gamma-aminobutyrate hydrolase family protein [Terracidiphilus sp.]
MSVRIAIPVPTSSDAEYNARSLPPYLEALKQSGAEPVIVTADLAQAEVARLIAQTQGIILPGSRFDVDPQRYGAEREAECGPADPVRTALDELLLQDAFNLRKPILGICHGAQSLNVWCGGTLIQNLKTQVNHRAGREAMEAHPVHVVSNSHLSALLPENASGSSWVTSTHHQAVCVVGGRLRVAATSVADGVVEAIEGIQSDQFVIAVQWHPERSFAVSSFSRAIFAAFVQATEAWAHTDGRG